MDKNGFDLFQYATKYTGRIQVSRVGFVRQKFPRYPEADSVLRQCAGSTKMPDLLIKKYTEKSLFSEDEAVSALGTDFMLHNQPRTQMKKAFEFGLDKMAGRAASQLQKDLEKDKTTPTEERFESLLEATFICAATDSITIAVTCLKMAEAILDASARAAAAAAANLTQSGSDAKDKDVFYPTPSQVLRCRLLRALCSLVNRDAARCAEVLVNLPQTCLDVPDDKLNDIATISDIVMYAVLCSMSTMGREEFRRNVFENANLREWLEREDCKICHTLLNSFFHCQWSSAWNAMETLIQAARFDMFINPVMDQVANSIRSKVLLEYCRAYETINIEDMAKSFDLSMSSLESMLLVLIKAGRLSARIDGIQHRATRYTKDPRTKAFDATIHAGEAFQDWTDRDLYYANIVDAGYLNADAVRKAIQEFRSFMMSDLDYDDEGVGYTRGPVARGPMGIGFLNGFGFGAGGGRSAHGGKRNKFH